MLPTCASITTGLGGVEQSLKTEACLNPDLQVIWDGSSGDGIHLGASLDSLMDEVTRDTCSRRHVLTGTQPEQKRPARCFSRSRRRFQFRAMKMRMAPLNRD